MGTISRLSERRRLTINVVGFLVMMVFLAGIQSGYCANVAINPSQTFQTIEGWGNGSGDLGGECDVVYRTLGQDIADPVNFQMIDYLAYDLGLTGTRIWEIGCRPDGQGLDNGDCDVVDWSKFQPGPYADVDARYMQHFRDDIIAGGAQPSFYSSTFYSNGSTWSKPWVLNHPGERSQQIWTNALYWRDHYGINMNYAVISNEPGAGNGYTAAILGDDIKALGPRLVANGLSTRIQFPEAVDPQTGWTLITALQNDTDVWPYVGRLSYHHYGSADPYRANIRDFGLSKGIPTAQTEMDPATYSDLFADLTLGGVTYWEVSYSSTNTLVPNGGLTTFAPSKYYFPIRQVTHYVRPGAVRIGTTNDPSLNVLAFAKNGAVTTVIWNTSGTQTVNVSGLPQGVYGISQSTINSTTPFSELGLRTVGADGNLTNISVGGSTVTTLYPYSGPNHAPTITTWQASPGRVVPPASTATLSVTANDTEQDPLTYTWSVTSQPTGANAVLATPNAATTSVSGLTQDGAYVFNLDVNDGVNTSSKQVYLVVGANQAPLFGVSGFRFGAPYGYQMDFPGITPLHAIFALPAPAVYLSANISDLENDTLTGQWSLVSQPTNASVTLSQQTYVYLSYRATVNNMTAPGDYTFQLDVHDPTHTVSLQVTCTVTPTNTPPTINTISAAPAAITLPVSSTQLSAGTSDPEGDLLRHWWVVKTVPAGAKPVFDHQGLANSTVSGLTLPGSYTFTLRCFDDIHMTTRDVTVTVNPGPPAATPTFDPAPGTYSSIQNVTISSATSGTTIRYTTNGTTPSESNGTVYTGPVQISGTTTLKAMAYGGVASDSAVASGTYIFQPIQKDRISDVKSLGSGYLVSMASAKVAEVASGVYLDGGIYVSEADRTSGLKVLSAGAVSLGDNLSLTGLTDTDSATGETILRATSVTKGANTNLFALGIGNKVLTPSAQLVTLWGRVTGVSPTFFTIDDGGAMPAHVETDGLVNVLTCIPSVGDYVSATGPAGMMAGGVTAVRVRSQTDIQDCVKCSLPTFSPAPGTYTNSQTVTISTNTGGATIRYTTDGSDPSETNGTIGNTVTITSNTTLKAIAYRSGLADSAIASGSYFVKCAQPTFTPVPGSYSSPQTVTISCATPGATIRYTTDGSDPSETNGNVGSSVFISADTTLKAIAYVGIFADSDVTSGFYHIYQIQCATPTFSLPAGTYGGSQTVTITDTTAGVTIRYTTDGSAPSQSNGTIGTSVTISSSCTLKAIAYMAGAIDSGVASAAYTITSGQTYDIAHGLFENTRMTPDTTWTGLLATQTGSDGWYYRVDTTSISPWSGTYGSSYAFPTNISSYPLCPIVWGPGSASYDYGWGGQAAPGTLNQRLGFICNSNEQASFQLKQPTQSTAVGFIAGWQSDTFPTIVVEWRAPTAGTASANFLCYSQQLSSAGAGYIMGLYRNGVFAQYLASTSAVGPTNYGAGNGSPLTASGISMNAGDSIVIVCRSAQYSVYGTRQMDTSVSGSISLSY